MIYHLESIIILKDNSIFCHYYTIIKSNYSDNCFIFNEDEINIYDINILSKENYTFYNNNESIMNDNLELYNINNNNDGNKLLDIYNNN